MKKKTSKKAAKKRSAGRPTRYKPEFVIQVRKLCLLGATDKELADFFSVSEKTLNVWKQKHPEFLQSLKGSKAEADSQVVRSLFQRATGYSHPEEKIFCEKGNVTRVDTVKHYPPDTTAAIFWLKNRQREKWRDRIDHEHGGIITHEHRAAQAISHRIEELIEHGKAIERDGRKK